MMIYKIYAINTINQKQEEREFKTHEAMVDDFNKLVHETEQKNLKVIHSTQTINRQEMILAVITECRHNDFERIELGGTDETITICHECGREL